MHLASLNIVTNDVIELVEHDQQLKSLNIVTNDVIELVEHDQQLKSLNVVSNECYEHGSWLHTRRSIIGPTLISRM